MSTPYEIMAVEDAILAALAPLRASHGVRQVEPYGGDLDPERLAAAVQQWPALLTFYVGGPRADLGQRRIETMGFVVLVCAKHAGDQAKARRGGSGGPGSYQLLRAASAVLEGKILLPGVFPVAVSGVASELQGGGMSVYSLQIEIDQPYLVAG